MSIGLARADIVTPGQAAGGSGTGQATHLKGFIASGTTLTVPTKNQIVVCEDYIIEGTGVLVLEGTATLCILGPDADGNAGGLSLPSPVPSQLSLFALNDGTKDILYASMQKTGGTWDWVEIARAP